jgi:hypothetical protein
MAHSKSYVAEAIKLYQANQPAYQLPVVSDDGVIDVQFREIPKEVTMQSEVVRLVRGFSKMW